MRITSAMLSIRIKCFKVRQLVWQKNSLSHFLKPTKVTLYNFLLLLNIFSCYIDTHEQMCCLAVMISICYSGLLLRNNVVIYSLEKKSEGMSQHDNNVSCVNDLKFDLSLFIRQPDTSPANTKKMFVFVTIETVVLQWHQWQLITWHLGKCCNIKNDNIMITTTFRQMN